MSSMARDTRKYKAKKKQKKKNREIEACLVDQSITAILAEENRRGRVCVCVCVCVCVSERRKIEQTA